MKEHIRGLTALLVASAFLSVACGTQKKATTHLQEESQIREALQAQTEQVAKTVTDSVQYRFQNLQQEMAELRATFAEQIPMIQVRETIPMQSLIDLPEGAKYGAANGRATVEARRQGDSIVLTGRCDSIARRCTLFERQTYRQKSTIDSLRTVIDDLRTRLAEKTYEDIWSSYWAAGEQSETVTAPKPVKVWRWFLGGAVSGIAASVAAGLLWKRFSLGKVIKGIISKIFFKSL